MPELFVSSAVYFSRRKPSQPKKGREALYTGRPRQGSRTPVARGRTSTEDGGFTICSFHVHKGKWGKGALKVMISLENNNPKGYPLTKNRFPPYTDAPGCHGEFCLGWTKLTTVHIHSGNDTEAPEPQVTTRTRASSGLPVVPFCLFFWEASLSKMDYRKKLVPLF